VSQILTREEVEALLQIIREGAAGLDQDPASGKPRESASDPAISGGFRVSRHDPQVLRSKEGSGSVS